MDKEETCDVAIVGAGIAGVSTAYFTLRHTDKKVLLIDGGRIAHGATGHNAGQVVSYFERPLPQLVEEYGLQMAMQGQYAVESAWYLLEEIQHACRLSTPLYRCTGYMGLSSLEQIIAHLEASKLRAQAGFPVEPMLLALNPALQAQIPKDCEPFYLALPHSSVLRLLETEDSSFIAAVTSPKGCMNSALFCEELVGYLVAAYPGRFIVAEHLPVNEVVLHKDGATLHTNGPLLHAKKVVLCTNGFESLTITNNHGDAIDRSFHAMVQGVIGYMSGYLEPFDQSPAAISYFPAQQSEADDYTYFTRRPFEHSPISSQNLVCVGGPVRMLPDCAGYDAASPFPSDIEEELHRTLHAVYKHPLDPSQRAFLWHGLMGYTPTKVRSIGVDPRNPGLLYNLGCNGVGILPSIYGGKRVAQILAGTHLSPSIFDPELQLQVHSS